MIRKTTKVSLRDSTLYMGPLRKTAFRMSDTDEDRQFRQALQEGSTKGKAASPERWGYTPKPGMLYVAVRAISSRVNANFDGWPKEELEKSWKTFIGRPVFVEHQNWDHTKTRGVIKDAKFHKDRLASGQDDWWVELLTEVDVVTYPKLGTGIIKEDIDSVSMGCDVEYTVCSACGNKARDVFEFCSHIPALKGQTIAVRTADGQEDPRLVYESCHGINFFEISYVFDPADESAFVSDYYRVDESLASISSNNTSNSAAMGSQNLQIDMSGLRVANRKTADPSVQMRMPGEVDTLREEIVCSVCGTEYDDTEEICPECGHQEPPDQYKDPDTTPRGEEAERLREVIDEFGETDGEPVPLENDGTPDTEFESETPQGPEDSGEAEDEGSGRPNADEIEEEFGVSLPDQNIDFYVKKDKKDEKGRPRRRRRKRKPDASQAAKNAWHQGLIAGIQGNRPTSREPDYLMGHREGLRSILRNGDEDMQTNTATSDRNRRLERARAVARAKARRAARSKATQQEEAPTKVAKTEEKVASKEAPQDYTELREKLRAQARQRFAKRIASIREAESNEQLRNEPATEDVESKGAGSMEQERNEPDTEDVESDNFNESGEQNAADRPSDINDSDQPDSAVTTEDSNSMEPAKASNRGDLIKIFTYVEDLEARGILDRNDRYANIARFEQMGTEKFAGYKQAMEDAKQHIAAAKQAPAPRKRQASNNGNDERPVARVPDLGRRTVEAAAGTDGDHMDDSLAFL